MTEVRERALTAPELMRIRRAINETMHDDTLTIDHRGYNTDAAAIMAIFDAVAPEWREGDSFEPGSVRIPFEQCNRIMDWCASAFDCTTDRGANIRLQSLLDLWVNKGPSTFGG